jgi:hypothetical protein
MVTFHLDDERWLLTSDSPGSAERPVLLHHGRAYLPNDLCGHAATRVAAWAYVQLRARPDADLRAEISLAQAYLRQWPEGPQLIPSQLSRRVEEKV